MSSMTSMASMSSNTSKLHSKQELINLILIEFKDYRWTIDDDDELRMLRTLWLKNEYKGDK